MPAPGALRRGGSRRCSTALPADRRPARLAVEPGRFLVARAGWLVASVLHVRDRADGDRVVVLDAGMTELIRPALYGAHHRIAALTSLGHGGRRRRPAAIRPPASTARSARAPTRFDRHDLPALRRATSSRSRTPARTPRRWR